MWPEVTERAAPLLVTSDTPGTTAQAAARLSLGAGLWRQLLPRGGRSLQREGSGPGHPVEHP